MDRALPIFRRKRGGGWTVVGPDHLLVPGETATVARKDGSTTEVLIEETSNPFWEDGTKKCWATFVGDGQVEPPSLF